MLDAETTINTVTQAIIAASALIIAIIKAIKGGK